MFEAVCSLSIWQQAFLAALIAAAIALFSDVGKKGALVSGVLVFAVVYILATFFGFSCS
jgi:hypothetical protein